MMYISRYVIPEDGDEMAHPNIFELNNGANHVSLKSLKAAFPMKGTYHFRFLTSVNIGNGKDISVWMDCSDDNATVPMQNGCIFAKLSRISSGISSSSSTAAVAATISVPEEHKRRNSDKLINFDADQKPTPITTTTAPLVENDLLGLSSSSSPSSSSSTQQTPVSVFSTGI